MINILVWWGIVGYFLVPLLPHAKTKPFAILQLVLGGPALWFIFPFAFAVELHEKNKK